MRGFNTRGRARQTTPRVAAAAASAILPCHRLAASLPGNSHAGQITRFCRATAGAPRRKFGQFSDGT